MNRKETMLLIPLNEAPIVADASSAMMTSLMQIIHPAQAQLLKQEEAHWLARVGRFGRILTTQETAVIIEELEGRSPEMAEVCLRSVEWRQFGLVPCVEHTAAAPDGIFGFAHISALWPCSDELFEAARSIRFRMRDRPLSDLPKPLAKEVVNATRRWMNHHKSTKSQFGSA